ncbi:MAG: hypothetical protein K2N42_00850 [Anaeroplasmataceae bacterium]|nr:hypothetical protein [Anaeroplasmataceae bacterium]
MEGKQFGLSLDETRAFGNWAGQSNVVSTKIPNRIFFRLDHTMADVGVFKSGIVTVQSSMLNVFNKNLFYIMII